MPFQKHHIFILKRTKITTDILKHQERKSTMITSKIYGYARVSSKEQNLDRQIEALINNGVAERDIITDKASGKNFERPAYTSLKNHMLRSGDTLIIKSLDRLGRNKEQTKTELKELHQMGVRVKIIDLPTTMVEFAENQEWVLDMVNNILIEVLGTIAEQERKTTRQRQAEGYAAMKVNEDGKKVSRKTGKVVGRQPIQKPINFDMVYDDWIKGNITAVEAMRKLNLSKTTFYRMVKRLKTNE